MIDSTINTAPGNTNNYNNRKRRREKEEINTQLHTQQQKQYTRPPILSLSLVGFLLLLVTSTSVITPPSAVSSFQLYRRHHRHPSPTSLVTTQQQQTASLHAPSSSSSSSPHSRYLPALLRRPPQPLHKELEEFQLYYTGSAPAPSSLSPTVHHENNYINIYDPSSSIANLSSTTTTTTTPLVEDQEAEYQRRRDEWAHRYTRIQGLRDAFGSNKNKLWGDLDAASTRRLYKTLLPNALCELIMDLDLAYIKPQELAPLAYKARKAAKLYARERCHLPTRLLATLFDGFRALRRYGKFQPSGMSYDQVWDKYQRLILEDVDDSITEEEIVARTCLKIMERSCKTNEHIDRIFLKNDGRSHAGAHNGSRRKRDRNLQKISQTLESDVRKLLDPFSAGQSPTCRGRGMGRSSSCHRPQMTQQQYHALKHFALARRQQQLEAEEATAAAAAAASANAAHS
jgi:hypothetical protein